MKRIHTLTAIALGLAITGFTGSASAGSCGSDKADTHGKDAATITASAKNVETVQSTDIVTTAINAGSFETLVTAIKSADLVETLQGEGPFTVFAPTDEAFAKLPESAITALLKDKKQLQAVLTYHVVPGTVLAADVVKLESATTVNGQPVTITVNDKTVMVNEAKVIATDIICSNGVIHVIDQVILPEAKTK
jgi:uncharacterized surface protein with fasciclin (FAS1) repeats